MTAATWDPRALSQGWEDVYRHAEAETMWQDEPVPLLQDAVEMLRLQSARTVLDIGCGDGRNVAALAKEGFACSGLDVSATALSAAVRRTAASGLTAFFLESDVTSMPLVTGSVDAVTCFDAFSHFVDAPQSVGEIQRVLRPGGLLICNVFNTEDSECGQGELVDENTYSYRGTMFRFYTEGALRAMFDGWEMLVFRTVTWMDPPHGDFRPYPHQHSSFVFTAVAPGGASGG